MRPRGNRAGHAEITFLVERAAERGFIARPLGASIFTEGSSLHDLHAMARDAVRCHFGQSHASMTVRLRFADDVIRKS
jgi:hypothetical protein